MLSIMRDKNCCNTNAVTQILNLLLKCLLRFMDTFKKLTKNPL